MKKLDIPDFKVGQLAETRTFEKGYRSAWFRCKIIDISPKKTRIKPEYYDFTEAELTWTQIYQVPPYGRKSKHIEKQLMARPQYPPIYDKSETIPVTSSSEACVVVDGTWKVGDLVDWHEDDSYWCARVVEVLSDDKVQIDLPLPPVGEGDHYVASCKDLRPTLEWSPRNGWTLSAVEGQTSCSARLVYPSMQGMDSNGKDVQNTAASSLHASSSSHMSVNSLAVPFERNLETQTSEQRKPVNTVIFQETLQSQQVKMDEDVECVTGKASSSDSISTSNVQETKGDAVWEDLDSFKGNVPQNIMHDDTLEASILDLEELVNKVKWMKTILQSDQLPNDSRSSWKFVEHHSMPNST